MIITETNSRYHYAYVVLAGFSSCTHEIPAEMGAPTSGSAEGSSTIVLTRIIRQRRTYFRTRIKEKERGVQILPCRVVPVVAMLYEEDGSTMGQERLNHLMTLNVHIDSIDSRQRIYVRQLLINFCTFCVSIVFAQLYKYSGYL